MKRFLAKLLSKLLGRINMRGQIKWHLKPNVFVEVKRGELGQKLFGPKIFRTYGKNLTVNVGKDDAVDQLHGTASTTTAQFIALATASFLPAADHVNLPFEVTAGGLERSQGIYSKGSPVGQGTVQKTFTYIGGLGTTITIYGSGLYDASTGGNLYYEDTFAVSATLAVNDQITVTWVITVG